LAIPGVALSMMRNTDAISLRIAAILSVTPEKAVYSRRVVVVPRSFPVRVGLIIFRNAGYVQTGH
jgi:hypothetical protein